MHVLMLSLDTTILKPPEQSIGNARARHERYAEMFDGRISMVVCSKRGTNYPEYRTARVIARATESRNYLAYLRDGYRVAMRYAREQPIDLITTQDPFLTALIGLALRTRLRAPLLVQDHSSFLSSRYFVAERGALIGYGSRLLALLTLPRANAVRVVNRRERLACIRIGVRPDRVCVIPVAVNLRGFAAPVPHTEIKRWRERLGLNPETPTVLWVGHPAPPKNLPMLLNAFGHVVADLPDARLILAGDMNGTNIVGQAAARGLAESVIFPGPVAHTDLPALYQLADVFALSSDYEGLPRVLLEAGAAGLPVVSTDNGGAADLIVDGMTGALVAIGDGEAMAQTLIALLRDPVRRQAISERARQHILSNFEESGLMARWVNMQRNVAARRAPCAF